MCERSEDLAVSLKGFPAGFPVQDRDYPGIPLEGRDYPGITLQERDHCKGCGRITVKPGRMSKLRYINCGGHTGSYSRHRWGSPLAQQLSPCHPGPHRDGANLTGSKDCRDLTKPFKGDPCHYSDGGKKQRTAPDFLMSENQQFVKHKSVNVMYNSLSKTGKECRRLSLGRTKRLGNIIMGGSLWYSLVVFILIFGTLPGTTFSTIMEEELFDGSGEADGDRTVLVSVDTSGYGSAEYENSGEEVPYDSTQKARDVVDKFLSIVEQYEKNKENCTAGTGYNLGDGVVAQYGVRRFKQQALTTVNRANLLTRIWKMPKSKLHKSEYFFYTQVRNLLEGDDDLFAAGNCYDRKEFRNYELWCPYAYRMPNDSNQIMVKDLAVVYKYFGNDSEFFHIPKLKAQKKLREHYNVSIGE